MKKNKLCLLFAIILLSFLLLFSCQNNNPQQIKNIIIMIGDGMGPEQEEAARIYSGEALAWDSFTYSGTVITNNVFGEVTDSAAAGTALSTGFKTSKWRIKRDKDGNDLFGIMDYAQEAGKRTGVITSKFLYDATPAAFSAYADKRQDYEVIKSSQIESGIDLLIGEALKSGEANYDAYQTEIIDAGYEYITDGNLLDDYSDVEKIFAPISSIVPEATEQNQFELESLVEFSLDFLDCEEGFVLMVEGGKIDDACHQMNIEKTLNELLAFHRAVNIVLEWAENRDDTIIIVTADHETGGLVLLPDVSADNILSGNYVVWDSSGAEAPHTSTPVNYYIYGVRGANIIKLLEDLEISENSNTEIDNTDIFNICKTLLEYS